MSTPPAPPSALRSTKAQRLAWCLYDFGNSAYPTVIITAVYALYFSGVVVGDAVPGRGDELWGFATSLGALAVVLTAPLLGALADRYSAKRRMLRAHAALCIAATAALAVTGPGTVALAMVLVVVSLYAFEGGNIFYNAFLPELVEPAQIPRLSGLAWASGYLGGLLALLVVLGLTGSGLGVHWLPVAVAAWFLVFTLPLLVLARDAPLAGGSGSDEPQSVLGRLLAVREHPELMRFLVALFFYMNGLNTVYVFAALFAKNALGFTTNESIVLIMVLNLVAAPGAMLFARLAERTSARRSIALSLWLWLAVVAGAVVTAWPGLLPSDGARRGLFWGVAAVASLCIGATQATSRTFVAQIAPPGMSSQFFGFVAFAGRASGVLGPLVYGQVSAWTGGDQRWAIASVGLFFGLGLILLRRVPEVSGPVARA